MGLGFLDYAVLSMIAVIAGVSIYRHIKDRKNGCGSCGSCPHASVCHKKTDIK